MLDWPLFGVALLLSVLGIVYIYSATWVAADPPGVYFSPIVKKQIAYLVIALIAFYFIRRINWGLKPDNWLWFYIPVMIPLLLVLFIGHGRTATGAQRWISLGIMDFQPSEFAKIGLILILAWLFSGDQLRIRQRYLGALAVVLSMVILVMFQPDLGTSVVFMFILFVTAMFTSLPRRWLVLTVLILVILAIPGYFMLHTYQKNRLLAFIGYELVKQEDGSIRMEPAHNQKGAYQVYQSRIAVGSGGLTGKGFLRGTQSRGGFIPEIESDFIFALVAEEFGLAGSLLVLLLYFLLLARILAIARDAKTSYEMYICYGASAMIFFHVFVGIGMTIGITPITGLPLPFISQGGSSLMTMWLLIAICQAIYSNSRQDFQRRY